MVGVDAYFISTIISAIICLIYLFMFGLYWYTLEKSYSSSWRVLFALTNLIAATNFCSPILDLIISTHLDGDEEAKDAKNIIYILAYGVSGVWLFFCLYR